MQKPVKRGNAWRIQVRYKNLRDSVTRDTARECEQWAAIRLLEMKAEYDPKKTQMQKPYFSFFILCQKYYDEVGYKKRGKSFIKQQIKRETFKNYFGELAEKSIYEIKPIDIKNWPDKRLEKVAHGTVHRQMCLYTSVFNYAKNELFLIEDNPFAQVTKPTKPPARNRLISHSEIEIILKALNYTIGTKPQTPRQYVAWTFLFAIETAMRKGEILGSRVTISILITYICQSQKMVMLVMFPYLKKHVIFSI